MDGRKNKPKTKRTKEAKEFLKLYYQDVTYKEVAEYFKLALRTVQEIAISLGIKKIHEPFKQLNITKEKLKIWFSLGLTTKQICKNLNIKADSFRQWLSDNDLSIQKIKLEIYQELLEAGLSSKQIANKLNVSEVAVCYFKRKIEKMKMQQNQKIIILVGV